MRALKVVWGLLVDDGRLAFVLALALVISFVLSHFHQPLLGALVIWVGLLASLWISIEHQLKLKAKK